MFDAFCVLLPVAVHWFLHSAMLEILIGWCSLECLLARVWWSLHQQLLSKQYVASAPNFLTADFFSLLVFNHHIFLYQSTKAKEVILTVFTFPSSGSWSWFSCVSCICDKSFLKQYYWGCSQTERPDSVLSTHSSSTVSWLHSLSSFFVRGQCGPRFWYQWWIYYCSAGLFFKAQYRCS